jgi:hypothetical protein
MTFSTRYNYKGEEYDRIMYDRVSCDLKEAEEHFKRILGKAFEQVEKHETKITSGD